jgi:hypothetical protein
MKEITLEQEAKLLLNQEIKVTSYLSQFYGETGYVKDIMPDGRTLDVELVGNRRGKPPRSMFLDVTLVSEIRERTQYPKGQPDLGPVANSVVQDHK